MLVKCMTLVDLFRLVRGESLRQCAKALSVPPTTLMENISSGRFLLVNQARQVGRNLGPYARAAGFDDGVEELFLRAYAFEAKLRDCLADRALFEAAVSCASRVLKAYLPGSPGTFSPRALLDVVFGRVSAAPEDAASMVADYLFRRLGDCTDVLDQVLADDYQGAVYDVLISLARALRVEFDPASGSAWVVCEPVRGEPVRSEVGLDISRRHHPRFGLVPRT